jgi:hypothetical protein
MKYVCLIPCLICLSACSSNNSETQENEVATVEPEENVYIPCSTNEEPSNESSSEDLSPRAKAFQEAYNLGMQLGASDAQKGENNCRACAASYTDEWIRMQFVQGYEVGYNGVMAERSYEPGYEDDDDNYYYYEE